MKIHKKTFLGINALLLLLNLSSAQTQEFGELKRIYFERVRNGLEVKIELDKLSNYKSFPLTGPNRLVIDFFQVNKFSCESFIDVADFGVKNIRVGRFKPDVVRVVFDLTEKIPLYTINENRVGLSVSFWFKETEKELPVEKITTELPKEEVKKEEEAVKEAPPKIPEKEVVKEEKPPEKIVEKEEKPVIKAPPQLPEEIIEGGKEEAISISIGIRGAFYFPHSSDFQDAYGKSLKAIGGEAVFKFPLREKEYIGACLGFVNMTADSKSGYEKSSLKLMPVSFSAFYTRQLGGFFPYIGIGIDCFFYSEDFPEISDTSSPSQKAWGANIQAGICLELGYSVSLKLYTKYHTAHIEGQQRNINLGGNEYGIGLSYGFKI